MKFIREVQKREFIITNKKGKQVNVKVSDYYNFGPNVNLYGNKGTQFREYMQMTFDGKYFNIWPKVKKIQYDKESDLLLFEDYVEIYDNYNNSDEPFITEIFFYVDFDGNIITDAYSPISNKYYSLVLDRDIEYPWIGENLSAKEKFWNQYNEIKEEIGWKILFLTNQRKKRIKDKLLNRKKSS